MARTISVSDEVYERMSRLKEDRSFSELIMELMKQSDLEELEGIGFSGNWEKVKDEVQKASESNLDRIEERYS